MGFAWLRGTSLQYVRYDSAALRSSFSTSFLFCDSGQRVLGLVLSPREGCLVLHHLLQGLWAALASHVGLFSFFLRTVDLDSVNVRVLWRKQIQNNTTKHFDLYVVDGRVGISSTSANGS